MFLRKLLIFACFILLNIIPKPGFSQDRKIVNGILDARGVDWNHHLIKLEGDMDFYWQELLLPASADDSLPGYTKYHAPVPKPWTKVVKPDGTTLPALGYGTYRLRILVDNKDEIYGLKLRSIFTAYKLFIDGKLKTKLGTVGTTKETSAPQFLTHEIAIPITKKDSVSYQVIDMVIQVSNFYHRRAGAQRPIHFGTLKQIINSTKDTLILNLLLVGIILIIGLNHLLMYALRRLDISNFIFGLLSIIMILRNLSTGERLIAYWFPNMSWELLIRLDNFSGFGTMALFATFFYFSYRKSFPKIMFYIITGVGILITIAVFSTKAWVYGQIRLLFELYIGLGGLYLVFGVLLRAVVQKQKGSVISFIGMFLLYSTAVNDLLYSMGVINSVYIAEYGIAAFMVLQSYLLTKQSAVALLDNRKLSLELKQEKQSLEERIEERTQVLTNQASELENYKKEQENQNWINEGLNQIIDVMRKNKDNLSVLADQLLSALVRRINASMGALYLHTRINHEDKLKILANYGLNKEAQIDVLDSKEGLTGQCFTTGKANYIEDLPDKFFSITSGLGNATPKVLALIPMKIDELTIGVVEIASFHPVNDMEKAYLIRAIENITSQLNIVKINDESQVLINESRKLEEEARQKNEEMRENLEELKAVQEEAEFKEKENIRLLAEAKQKQEELEAKLKEALKENKLLQKDSDMPKKTAEKTRKPREKK